MLADNANSAAKLKEINREINWIIHEVDGFATTLPDDWIGYGTKRNHPAPGEGSSHHKKLRVSNEQSTGVKPGNRQPTLSQVLGTPDIAPDIVIRPKPRPKPKTAKKKQRLKAIDPRKEGCDLHNFLKRRKLDA